jgi:hypothetical protein
MDVVLLLLFVFAIFSILGIQFFAGMMHARCRMTPHPIKMPALLPDDNEFSSCCKPPDGGWTADAANCIESDCFQQYMAVVVNDPDAYACMVDDEGTPIVDEDEWTQTTSPWTAEQDCFWPLVPDDTRVCSVTGGGMHGCNAFDVAAMDYQVALGEATGLTFNSSYPQVACGSNYDNRGNPRFVSESHPYGFDRMTSGTFTGDLNFGYTTFDNMGAAFVTIFQSVTMEGWIDVMYMVSLACVLTFDTFGVHWFVVCLPHLLFRGSD